MKAKTKMKTKVKTKTKMEMKIKTKRKWKRKWKQRPKLILILIFVFVFILFFNFVFVFLFVSIFVFVFVFVFIFFFVFIFVFAFVFLLFFVFLLIFFLVFIFKFYYGNSRPPYYFKGNISFVFEICKWKTRTKIKNQGLQYSRLLLQFSGMKFTKNILDLFPRSLQASILNLQREVGHLFPVWMTSYWLMLSEHVYNWSKFKVRSRDVFFS